MILIPINHQNLHWSLAAINLRKKRIESYDSLGSYHAYIYKVCPNFIIHNSKLTSYDYKKLRSYLQEEHLDKKKKPFDFTGWEDYHDEVFVIHKYM